MASSDSRSGPGDEGAGDQAWRRRRASESVAQSQSRRPTDGQSAAVEEMASAAEEPSLTLPESWIEIASQPSSSSLSSIGDEIVTTGLRVGGQTNPPHRRRRRLFYQQPSAQTPLPATMSPAVPHAGTSSQDEYDETESDEDRLMTSSTENVAARPPGLPAQQTAIGPAVDSESDDDRATALGRPSSSPTFRPQPNAFSHPPNHLQHRSHSTNSSVPPHPHFHRPSMSHRAQTRVHRPNFMSPSYREDNDAALRASLTTLLSCAAAARALPKKDDTTATTTTAAGPSAAAAGLRPGNQPLNLRLVAESELMGATTSAAATAPARPALRPDARTASNSSAPSRPASTSSRDAAAKTKRAAPAPATGASTKPARAAKKKRTAAADASGPATATASDGAALFSPTLLTWVVSAGVLVLVSVVGFGAGYVIGREAGYREAVAGGGGGGGVAAANTSSGCGGDIARSSSGGTLRRFRWGAGMARSVAA